MTQVYLQRELEPLGLGHGQVRLLRFLDEHPGTRQQDITNHFHLDKGSTSTLISSLVDKGFVIREKDPIDSRAYCLKTTSKMDDVRPRLKEVFTAWTEKLMDGFTEEERTNLLDQFERMIWNADPEFYKKHHNGQEKIH